MSEISNEILTSFHTSLRNVGLFTSVSFAALTYSRYYRSKNDNLYNISLIIISIAFIITSIIISIFLISDFITGINDLKLKNNNKNYYKTEKWLNIPYFVSVIEFLILLLALFTLYRESKDILYKKE